MIPREDTRPRVSEDEFGWIFECPGCGLAHVLNRSWSFNGDLARPTFLPSFLSGVSTPDSLDVRHRCHLQIYGGQIQFFADCTHSLAGQTVDMAPWQ
jgi:hypothetical protein